MRNNPEHVQTVVVNHLFQGEVSAEEVEPAINVEIENGDIPVTNGLLHSTNDVIIGE